MKTAQDPPSSTNRLFGVLCQSKNTDAQTSLRDEQTRRPVTSRLLPTFPGTSDSPHMAVVLKVELRPSKVALFVFREVLSEIHTHKYTYTHKNTERNEPNINFKKGWGEGNHMPHTSAFT